MNRSSRTKAGLRLGEALRLRVPVSLQEEMGKKVGDSRGAVRREEFGSPCTEKKVRSRF